VVSRDVEFTLDGKKIMQQAESKKLSVGRLELFRTFSRIALSSFGGALFWARLGLVERERWLSWREFANY
jgi:hypothetical protein